MCIRDSEKTNTVYEDIEDAIEQATEGDTIVLTKNAEVETPITLDKSCLLYTSYRGTMRNAASGRARLCEGP